MQRFHYTKRVSQKRQCHSFLALAVFLIWGCSNTDVEGRCSENVECPAGICRNNQCLYLCSKNTDCVGAQFDGPYYCNSGACVPSVCGDGEVEGLEECDDANEDNLDGCTNTCRAAICGDRFLRTDVVDITLPEFEVCDDGNEDNQDACLNNCRIARCGDAVVRTNIQGSATPGFEECDDGNDVDNDLCSNNCRLWCGNAVLDGDEECDDAFARADGDGCDALCVVETGWTCSAITSTSPSVCAPICGDGVILGEEACDDGNLVSGDGCDAACAVESSWACAPNSVGISVCSLECIVAGVCRIEESACTEFCTCPDTLVFDTVTESCVCDVGYVPVGPNTCRWNGVVTNSGFDESTTGATGWTLNGGVTFSSVGTGNLADPGVLQLPPTDVMANTATVADFAEQTITMPKYAGISEGLELRITYRAESGELPLFEGQLAVFLNSRWRMRSHFQNTNSVGFCLGARALKAELQLKLAATLSPLEVDRVEILPNALCPAIGVVRNGDFDGTPSWIVAGSYAALPSTIGNDNAVYYAPGSCASVHILEIGTLSSIPLADERGGPALKLKLSGTAGWSLSFLREQQPSTPGKQAPLPLVSFLFDGQESQELQRCLPPSVQGEVVQTKASINASVSTQCVQALDAAFQLDDVEIVFDKACTATEGIQGGDFESPELNAAWLRMAGVPYSQNDYGDKTVEIGGELASPSTDLHLRVNVPESGEGQATARQEFYAPASPGQVLLFDYSASGTEGQAGVEISVRWSSSLSLVLSDVKPMTAQSLCLPTSGGGVPMLLNFYIENKAPEGAELRIDNVRLGVDPKCL